MPELTPTPARPALDGRSRPRLAPYRFTRTTLAPVGLLTAAFAVVAMAGHHWAYLVTIAEAAVAAVALLWALTTRAAARRGRPIHPVAHAAAITVIVAGIVAAVVLSAVAVFDPAALGLPTGGGR